MHPYEIVKIELVADNIDEKDQILEMTQHVEHYLTSIINAIEVIEASPPIFVLKKVKTNIGLGS
jgi:hypothetical protein